MTVFIKSVDMERTEFLELLVEKYLFARANHSNTLLGTPDVVSIAQGRLDGACMALGIDFRIEDKKYVFFTNKRKKQICEVSMGDYYDMINQQKEIEEKEAIEFREVFG